MSQASSLIPPPDVGGEGEVVASLIVNDLTADRLVYADSTKKLSSVANLASWVAGSNVTVADDGDGTITVSIPQSVATSASPTFAGLTLTGSLAFSPDNSVDLTAVGNRPRDIRAGRDIYGVTATLSGLTPTHVLHAGTGGLVSGDAGMTWDNTLKTLTQLQTIVNNGTSKKYHKFNHTDANGYPFYFSVGSGTNPVGARNDLVFDLGYNMDYQGRIDAAEVSWGLQWETFYKPDAGHENVEFILSYNSTAGVERRPFQYRVNRVDDSTDNIYSATTYSYYAEDNDPLWMRWTTNKILHGPSVTYEWQAATDLTSASDIVISRSASGNLLMQQPVNAAISAGFKVDTRWTDASGVAAFSMSTAASPNVWNLFARNGEAFLGIAAVADYCRFGSATTTFVNPLRIGALKTDLPAVLLHLGKGGTTQGYISLESAGGASRTANLYAPAVGGLQVDTAGNSYPIVLNGSNIKLYPGASVGWDIGSTPHLIPSIGNTYDLGASGTTVRTGYFGTSVFAAASIGVARTTADAGVLLHLGTGGTTQGYIRMESAGATSRTANLYVPSGGGLQIDTAGNSYDILLNGSTIKLYPGNVATLDINSGGLTLADAKNIIVNATTGTKIGTATTQKIGLWNAAPVVQQVGGVTLTNNVTAGGTTNQLDDFTSLTIYATDAAAIRNNIYQLGRKLKLVTDLLRTIGAAQNADA